MTHSGNAKRIVLISLWTLTVACQGGAGHDHDHGHEGEGKHEGEPAGEHREGGHDDHEEGVVELSPAAMKRVRIELATAERVALPTVLETTGEVDYDRARLAHVSPRVSGRVQRVKAALGDVVKAGEAMASIDSIELGRAKASYLKAKSEVELTAETLEREKRLVAARISSQQALIEAEAAARRAGVELSAAEQELRILGLSAPRIASLKYGDPQAARYHLVAPISGRVVEKHVTLGELVTPENPLFTVADLSEVWIWLDVYERDLARVHLEDRVEVRVQGYPDRQFDAVVGYIADRVNSATRAVRARVDVPNPEGLLKPGMFAQVRIIDPHSVGAEAGHAEAHDEHDDHVHEEKHGDGHEKHDAHGKDDDDDHAALPVVVPATAVQRNGDSWVAFVPDGDRRFVLRELKLGRRVEGRVEILHGLSPGERVVVRGTFLLKSEAAKHTMGGGHSH